MYCVDTRVPDLTPHERKPEFDGGGWEKQAVRKGAASRCEDEYASLKSAAFDAKFAESESEGSTFQCLAARDRAARRPEGVKVPELSD